MSDEPDGRVNNPYFANSPGCMSWHPYFSVSVRRNTSMPWPQCEHVNDAGIRCVNPDGMGHDRGNLKTPCIFST